MYENASLSNVDSTQKEYFKRHITDSIYGNKSVMHYAIIYFEDSS